MREYKKFFNRFAPYDKTGICKYLESKAADGWLLVDMSSIMWEYKRIEPQKLKFNISYVNKSSAYDYGLTENQVSFVEYCEHSGWKFAASFDHTFVFYTDNENTVPIETDTVVEVENIHYIMKRKLLVPYLLLTVSPIINLSTRLFDFFDDTVAQLLSGTVFLIIPLFLSALVFLSETVEYIVWYIRAKKLASLGGGFLATKNFSNIKVITVLPIMLISFLLYSVSVGDSSGMTAVLCGILVVVAVLLFTRGTTALLKKLNVPKTVNIAVSVAVCLAVSVACLHLSVNTVMKNSPDSVEDIYSNIQYLTAAEFSEAAPLEIADFIKETKGTKAWVENKSAVCAEKIRAVQCAENPATKEEYTLKYTVFEIKLTFLRRACINNLFDKYSALGNYLHLESSSGKALLDRVSHRKIAADVWSADEAYVLCVDGQAINKYLLCYGNKIVEFIPSWTLTEEQVKIVASTFGK
ncbi:MAG: DUF2812 domain-containing protein [Clostridia bacterium]|nr:DUF2812 domain-containing protein [Clostridia bacterium]